MQPEPAGAGDRSGTTHRAPRRVVLRAVNRVLVLGPGAAYRGVLVARAAFGPFARLSGTARVAFLDGALMELRRYLLDPPVQPKTARAARRDARELPPGELAIWRCLCR